MGVVLRWRKLNGGKQSAFLDISVNGERFYEFLDIRVDPRNPDHKEMKELAQRIRAQRELQIMSDEYDYQPKSVRQANFIDFFQNYIDDYKKPGIRKFRYALGKFKLYIGGDRISFSKLTPQLCQGFKEFLLDPTRSGLSGETPADYFKRFRTVLNQAVNERIIRENPAKNIQISIDQGQLKKEVLTAEELAALYRAECGNQEVKRAFLFACLTGLGAAELKKLTWGSIKDGEMLVVKREKTQKPISSPLSPSALRLLGPTGNVNDFIFNLPSSVAIRKVIINWVQRAGIQKKISFYCARHTFAILLLTHSNANPKVLADLMGHSSLKYLGKYLNYTDELKKSAVMKLPGIEGS